MKNTDHTNEKSKKKVGWFTSAREKRLWFLVSSVITAIFLTLIIDNPLAIVLGNQNVQAVFFVLGLVLISAAVITHGLYMKPSNIELSILLGIIAVYLMLIFRLGAPERSHSIEYSVLAIFVHKALLERARHKKLLAKPVVLALVISVFFGVTDEIIQLIVPNRVFDFQDIIFNTLAIIMAIASSVLLTWAKKRFSKPKITKQPASKFKQPWPTKAVMAQIYEKHFWGGTSFDFYSGFGSHDPDIIKPYIEATSNFLKSFPDPLVVCDLGCGDFNVGKYLVQHAKTYIAIDIVDQLIERNKKKFSAENLEFLCLDMSKDQLPKADCIILRQVLQHLSNAEIRSITQKLQQYKYLILTEHVSVGVFTPNIDIISGQGNRTKYSSGVDITKAPFNLKFKEERIIDNYILENNKGQITTTLFKLF